MTATTTHTVTQIVTGTRVSARAHTHTHQCQLDHVPLPTNDPADAWERNVWGLVSESSRARARASTLTH